MYQGMQFNVLMVKQFVTITVYEPIYHARSTINYYLFRYNIFLRTLKPCLIYNANITYKFENNCVAAIVLQYRP